MGHVKFVYAVLEEQMTDLENQFTSFLNEYSQKRNAQQTAIQSDLSLVENSAIAVMEQMQSFTVDTPLSANGTDSATVQLNQQGNQPGIDDDERFSQFHWGKPGQCRSLYKRTSGKSSKCPSKMPTR